MSDYLLDTNAVIALLNADPSIAMVLVAPHTASIPIIVVGELYFGAEKSGRVEANLKRTEEFLSRRNILGCDNDTTHWYGRLMQQLSAKGRPIPANDVWIAAIALQHRLILLTKDKHFENVDGLQVQAW